MARIVDDYFFDEEAEDGEFVENYENSEDGQAICPPIGVDEKNIEEYARHYITLFFADKEMHYGGLIPKHILLSDSYVKLVANTDVCKGIDEVYLHFGQNEEEFDLESEDDTLPEDISFLINTHRECSILGVPKEFVSGITIMYLELCKGVKRPVSRVRLNFGD